MLLTGLAMRAAWFGIRGETINTLLIRLIIERVLGGVDYFELAIGMVRGGG